MTNEFEDMYDSDDFVDTESEAGESKNEGINGADNGNGGEDLIAGGNQGMAYDYTKAPDTAKGPDREDLDGKTVTIEKAEIILPPPEKDWVWSKKKTVEFKPCLFIVHYEDGQKEFYSGVKVFKRKDDNGVEKYSHPQIQNNADSQASNLKSVYAKYKDAAPEEISLKQFMSFLNSKPKAVIKGKEFRNPETDELTKKNIINEFVS